MVFDLAEFIMCRGQQQPRFAGHEFGEEIGHRFLVEYLNGACAGFVLCDQVVQLPRQRRLQPHEGAAISVEMPERAAPVLRVRHAALLEPRVRTHKLLFVLCDEQRGIGQSRDVRDELWEFV